MGVCKKQVLGLMSGSSLDGLDIALCVFEYTQEPTYQLVNWSIKAGATIPYPKPWQARLRMAVHLPGYELWRLHADLGKYFGKQVARWMNQQGLSADLLGSHGHTLFHDPKKGYTTQIGDGAQIAYFSGLPTVSELRSSDLAAGGEGAPIAPLADQWLFPNHQAFLNLGGIANISLKVGAGKIIAGDLSGANQILDRLAQQAGQPFDHGGQLARKGTLLTDLLVQLQELPFHHRAFPKSLANDWVVNTLWPLVEQSSGQTEDKLHTFCHFLANHVHQSLLQQCQQHQLSPAPLKVLVTGGGAHNHFLLDTLRQLPQNDQYPLGYEVPDGPIGDLKEAALVALSALHRTLELPNALATVTGAAKDTVNGALYLP